MNDILGFLGLIVLSFLCIFVIIGIVIFPIATIQWNTKIAIVDVYCNNELVYTGLNRFVIVKQLGEVGNRYKVKILKRDFISFVFNIEDKVYITDNVLVK